MIGAVLLAAGSASRMGGRPKCLLSLDGTPIIRRQIESLMACGVADIVVVLGHYADQIEPAIKDLAITIIRNPQPENGQISSQRLGLVALPLKVMSVIVALADQPLIDAHAIRELIAAHQQRPQGTDFTRPFVGGLPGNPVIFQAAIKDNILQGATDFGGKEWQKQHPQKVYRWETPNFNYCIDVDTQEDIVSLTKLTGHLLKWS